MIYFNFEIWIWRRKPQHKNTPTIPIFHAIFMHTSLSQQPQCCVLLEWCCRVCTYTILVEQAYTQKIHFNGAPFKAFASVATINIVESERTDKKKRNPTEIPIMKSNIIFHPLHVHYRTRSIFIVAADWMHFVFDGSSVLLWQCNFVIHCTLYMRIFAYKHSQWQRKGFMTIDTRLHIDIGAIICQSN